MAAQQETKRMGEIGGFLNDAIFVWGPSLPPAVAWNLLDHINKRMSAKWGGPIAFTLTPPTHLN